MVFVLFHSPLTPLNAVLRAAGAARGWADPAHVPPTVYKPGAPSLLHGHLFLGENRAWPAGLWTGLGHPADPP